MTTPTDDDDFLFSGGIDDDDFLLAAEQAVRTQISPPPKLITSATPGYFPDSDDDEYGSDIDISELTPPQPDEIPDLEEEHELFHNATVEEDDPATPDDALPFPGSYNSSQDIHPADHDVIDLTSSPVVPPELSSSQALSHWDALGSGVKISPKRPAPKNGSPTKRKKIAQEPLRPKSLSRPPLPAIVLENSLVDGLTPKRNIRSCFCIASAIQLAERGDAGVKNDGLIELYGMSSGFSLRVCVLIVLLAQLESRSLPARRRSSTFNSWICSTMNLPT